MMAAGSLIVAGVAWAQSNPVKAGVDAWTAGNYQQAVKDWQAPAARGDADAEFNLGQAYKLGRGVPEDMAKAQDWYRKAAEQGHFQAQDNYGLLLFQSGKQSAAVPWLEKSVSRGEPRAELVLGTMLFNGDGGQPKDWPRAYALITRASDQGLAEATKTRAEMDKYIPEDQRKQGLALARRYEADAQHTQLPSEVAGGGSAPIRTTPVPPSQVAMNNGPGASYPAPGAHPAPPPPPAHTAPPPAVRPVPPHNAEPAPAPAPAASGGSWRVQLGAFSTEARARSLWQSLNPKVAALHGAQPYLVHAGAVTRLQAGSFASSAAAEQVCAAVKRAGNACLPINP
jgi:cell division septation protein DedD